MTDEQGKTAEPTLEDLFRRFLETVASGSVAASVPAVPKCFVEAVPDFSGTDIGQDAQRWCDLVESITDKLPATQRLSLATHALTGPAKKWYREWEGNPRTWQKFREDLCSVFVPEDRLCERLTRAVSYTSDSASSYTEYARNKLKYYGQTQIAFKPPELISLVIGHVMDASVRQSLMNGRYATVADLLSGIGNFVKVPKKDTERGSDRVRERGGQVRDYKRHSSDRAGPTRPRNFPRTRCYECNETGHKERECPKKRKNIDEPSRETAKRFANGPVCTFCHKRGHEESQCWAKQRTTSNSQNKKKPEVNVCYSMDHKLTPILLKDMFVQSCLIDNGATCSLVRERVAKRASCKIEPYTTTVQGLCDSSTTTIGCTTTIIQTQDVSTELDLFVVPDAGIPYDVIIGKNVLVHADLQIVTEPDGTTRLRRCTPVAQEGNEMVTKTSCYALDVPDEAVRGFVRDLLTKFEQMLTTGNRVRCVSTGEMRITTQEDKVINYHPYRLSVSEREKVQQIIADLLGNNIIRESNSPFASPIILVKKKNGKDRLCVDYRALNKITVRDRYPLPLIEDQLDRLGKGRFFTTLDMAAGFHQIPIAADSVCKTAFVTPDGHYEYLRMPFGLCNAPAVFQRAINTALGNLRNNIALVYIDDVLIPSETVEEGLQNLERVLEALDKAGFTLNIEKCKFLETSINYLGREISSEGVRPGKEKIKALVESPIPRNVKQVRQFVGLASYFRKFIPEFAVRTACLTRLTKTNEPWVWGTEQEEARQYVVDKLSTEPLLAIFDHERETELHTDASSIGYGAILFQKVENELRVVAYFSRRTTPEESRYHSYELETLAIVNALKYFRVYLLGIKFKIVTDCNAIKATQNKKDLLPRIARWWVFLQDYSFDLEYRKGKCIEHVDYLSRNPHRDYRVNTICEGSWLEVAQRKDEETLNIIKRLESNETVCTDFELREGILCRKILRDTGRIVYRSFVPKGSRLGLLRLYHDENCHVAFEKTYDRIAQKYWFPKMRRFVQKYIEHCITCVVCKRQAGPKQGKLYSIQKKPIPFVISKTLANDRYEIVGKSGRPQIVPKDRLRLWKGEWSGNNDIDVSEEENANEPC